MRETMFTYRVLHDIWLMGHPRMTLYLMAGQRSTTRHNKKQMEGRELEPGTFTIKKLYINYIQNQRISNDAFKREGLINK